LQAPQLLQCHYLSLITSSRARWGQLGAYLIQTKLPIVDIAVACGFVSASHFSKVYREAYGRTPQKTRISRTSSFPPSLMPQNDRMILAS
ncbi:helix-turn-helix domain-containing protein, partial [Mesorhizobium sp. M0103]